MTPAYFPDRRDEMPTRRLVLAAVLSLVPFAGTTPALAVGTDGYITRAEALARTSVLRPTGTYTTQYPGNPNTYRLPLRPTTWDLSNWTSINYDAFSSDGTSYPLIFGGGRLQVAAPKPVRIGGTVLGQILPRGRGTTGTNATSDRTARVASVRIRDPLAPPST